LEALPPSTFWGEWSRQVCRRYPEGIDKTSGCQSVATLVEKEDPRQLELNKTRARRKQMAAQVDHLIEKHKERKEQEGAAQRRKKSLKQPVPRVSLAAPRTQVAEKFAKETSLVGVGEMYRRTLVNVTAAVDKRRLTMNEINTETLLGLRVNQRVADIVIPPSSPT
jgi:hypothetical protein